QESGVAMSDESGSSSQSPSPPCTPPLAKSNDNNDLDQIVPTAIVIKNIPFSIKRDALLMLLESQNVPQPYAMNYHFDNGVFRGLAFANYRTHELALESTQSINKMTINGRQLRAEFKRMLPNSSGTTAEKVEDERKKEELEVALRQLAIASGDNNINNNVSTSLSSPSRRTRSGYDDIRQQLPTTPPKNNTNGVDSNNDLDSLDLDDPIVQGLIKKIKQFKKSNEEELVIPHLNGKRRRDAHIIAGSLGLGHFAEGIYPVRFMHVTKNPTDTLKSSLYQEPNEQQQPQQPQQQREGLPSLREGQRRSLRINLDFPPSSSSGSNGNYGNNNSNNNNEFVSVIRPIRQPRGPEPDKNFETRKHFAHLGRHATCVCQTPGVKI
ncbi:hypothetical protein INT45_000254, partial [Circinella minor]